MKYVIMFTSDPALDAQTPPEAISEEVYRRVYRWFAAARRPDQPTAAPSCSPSTTATTVRHGGDGAVVVDGPFSEAKEVIGGFSVLDVPDLDAAIAIVREWPMLELPGNVGGDPSDGDRLQPVRAVTSGCRGPGGRGRRPAASDASPRPHGAGGGGAHRRGADGVARSFDIAEESVAAAVEEAVRAWRVRGVPPNPGAWLSRAARNNALDRIRREQRYREKLALLAAPEATMPDESDPDGRRAPAAAVRMLPPRALARRAARADPARGVRTDDRADRAGDFEPEPDGRAAHRARQAQDRRPRASRCGSPRAPSGAAAPRHRAGGRVGDVQRGAPRRSGGDAAADRDIADDAVWLARRDRRTPCRRGRRPAGCSRCCCCTRARESARAVDGELVLLADQDRTRWDAALIAEAQPGARARRRAASAGAVAAARRDRRVPCGCRELGRDGLAAGARRSTTCCCATTGRRSCG